MATIEEQRAAYRTAFTEASAERRRISQEYGRLLYDQAKVRETLADVLREAENEERAAWRVYIDLMGSDTT